MDSPTKNGGVLGDKGTRPKASMIFCNGFNVKGTFAGFKVAAVPEECHAINSRPSGIFNSFFVHDDGFTCAIDTVPPKTGFDRVSIGFAGKNLR